MKTTKLVDKSLFTLIEDVEAIKINGGFLAVISLNNSTSSDTKLVDFRGNGNLPGDRIDIQ